MILSGRWVVPVSSPPLEQGAIVVEGSRILEVGLLETICKQYPGHLLKSFPEAALLPGFVNVHSHLELTVLRGYLEGLDFWRWIRTLTRTKYEVLNEEDILASALLGSVEALRAGVTTVADPMDIGASLDAVLATGLRAFSIKKSFRRSPPKRTQALQSLKQKIHLLKARLARWPEGHASSDQVDRRKRRLDRPPPAACDAGRVSARALHRQCAIVPEDCDLCSEHNYPVCIHAAESEAETQLVKNGSGPMMESLQQRGIHWNPPRTSPIAYLQQPWRSEPWHPACALHPLGIFGL